MSFCSRVPGYQRKNYSLELDKPLGKWHNVERNTWWPCYATKEGLIYRSESGAMSEFKRENNSVMHSFAREIQEVPVESHPIEAVKVGEKYWTGKRFRPTDDPPVEAGKPGYVVYNSLNRKNMMS